MSTREEVQHEPVEVRVEDGHVALAGPDGAVVALSPKAAEETSDRLWKGAMFARQKQRERDHAYQAENSDEPE
jgi:hypothetical protein